jgi:Fe-S-cluster containining protein
MKNINTFINIDQHDFYFKGCSSCDGDCCNGAKGFALSPLILEDFEDVYKNFAIVFATIDKQLRAFVVLNDGKTHCRYYKENRCSIYEDRTPACRLYPVSPYFEHILVDTECPSINLDFGTRVSNDAKLEDAFYTNRLDDFSTKLKNSFSFYKSINDIANFEKVGNILGMDILKYTKQNNNRYIQMHKQSLHHLSEVLK